MGLKEFKAKQNKTEKYIKPKMKKNPPVIDFGIETPAGLGREGSEFPS